MLMVMVKVTVKLTGCASSSSSYSNVPVVMVIVTVKSSGCASSSYYNGDSDSGISWMC